MPKPKVVVLEESDPYKRGCHHGEECRQEIQILHDAWKRHLCHHFSRVGGLARYFLTVNGYAAFFRKHIPADFLQEMRGVAAGAGCSLNKIIFINCFDDGFRILLQRGGPRLSRLAKNFWSDWESKLMACSSFAARKPDGNLIAGINLDEGIMEKELCRLVTAFVYKIPGQPKFISVLIPGYIGVLRGLNEVGVFVGHHTAHVRDARSPAIPHGLLLRLALEKTMLAQAVHRILKERRSIGSNTIIGDAKRAGVLEMATEFFDSRGMEDGRFVVCTNHFLCDEMHSRLRPEYIVPGSGFAEFILDPNYTHYRYSRLQELLEKSLPETPEEVCRILNEVSNDLTVQSVIFDPAKRTVYIAVPRSGFPPATRDCELFPIKL